MTSSKSILAFDFGLRRIGVAVGQNITGSASPLGIIDNRETGIDFEAISALIKEWQPDALIVGMPSHADGTASDIQIPVRAFMDELARFGLPVDSVDERHTSVEAEATLKRARQKGSQGRISKAKIDSASAVFIAERYFSSG